MQQRYVSAQIGDFLALEAKALLRILVATLLAVTFAGAGWAAADPVPVEMREPPSFLDRVHLRPASFAKDACDLIDRVARVNAIPSLFIARLISVESGFRPGAVSPKGASGIAQFMPETARLRRLANPFEPGSALKAAIEYLSELRHRFGNLGLAAAAYNAGENRVEAYIRGGGLPFETENYVMATTGRPAADWIGVSHPTEPFSLAVSAAQFIPQCLRLARGFRRDEVGGPVATILLPWGAQVAESFSRSSAIRVFQNLQRRFPSVFGSSPPMVISTRNYSRGSALRHATFLGARSRAEADGKCAEMRRFGVACLVLKTGS